MKYGKFSAHQGAKGQPHIVDVHSIRRVALMHKIPYYTLLTAASAGIRAIGALREGGIGAVALQEYHGQI